jgi:hypothetical protein
VLARSVPSGKPAGKPERPQRVSVRLSGAEERRLQRRAGAAGLTVSEYLRRSALAVETPEAKPETRANHGPAAASTLFAASSRNTSVLGDWISLLRNRFLSSPARIADRA